MRKFDFYTSKHQFKSFGILLLFSILLNSCYKDRFDIDRIAGGTWDPTGAAPLIKSSLSMSQIVDKSGETWNEDPDGLLSLLYSSTVYSDTANKLITIPTQTFDSTIYMALPPGMSVGENHSKFFPVSSYFQSPSGERLDKMFIKSGVLEVQIITNLNHNATLEVIITQLNKYGTTFIGTIPFTPSGAATTTVNASFPLNSYTLNLLTTGNGQKFSQDIHVVTTKGNNPNNSPYSIRIKEDFKNITFYDAFGYFHQKTFSISENALDISLFTNNMIGQLFLEDPIVRVRHLNSYGMPLEINYNKLYVEKDGIKTNFVSSLLPQVNLGYPSYSAVGQTDTTTLVFTKSNSNIVTLFNLNPHKLVVQADVKSNPLGAIIPNFITDSSRVGINIELELPLHGRAMKFSIQDTGDVELSNIEELQKVDFYINAYNEFPAKANLQIYLTDSNYVVIDSLFKPDESLLLAAPVGPAPALRTTSKVHKLTTVPISGAQLAKLDKMRHIIFKATLSTSEDGQKIVKVYSDYTIDFTMGMKASFKVDF